MTPSKRRDLYVTRDRSGTRIIPRSSTSTSRSPSRTRGVRDISGSETRSNSLYPGGVTVRRGYNDRIRSASGATFVDTQRRSSRNIRVHRPWHGDSRSRGYFVGGSSYQRYLDRGHRNRVRYGYYDRYYSSGRCYGWGDRYYSRHYYSRHCRPRRYHGSSFYFGFSFGRSCGYYPAYYYPSYYYPTYSYAYPTYPVYGSYSTYTYPAFTSTYNSVYDGGGYYPAFTDTANPAYSTYTSNNYYGNVYQSQYPVGTAAGNQYYDSGYVDASQPRGFLSAPDSYPTPLSPDYTDGGPTTVNVNQTQNLNVPQQTEVVEPEALVQSDAGQSVPQSAPLDEAAQKEIQKLMTAGVEHFARGAYQQAMEQFRTVMARYEDNVDALIAYAVSRFALGDYAQSANAIRKAIRLAPDIVNVPFDLRDRYAVEADFDQQLATLEDFVRNNPDDVDGWLVLGFTRHYTARRDDAQVVFDILKRRSPTDVKLADVFLNAKSLDEILAEMEQQQAEANAQILSSQEQQALSAPVDGQ